MLVYVSRKFTATVTGKELKSVTCEKCATEFHYELSRTGSGEASAAYYVGQDAAKNRAEKRAKESLVKRLSRETEMVPCPQCKWINSAAIAQFRKTRYQGTLIFGIVLSLFGFITALILYWTYEDTFRKPRQAFPKEVAVTCGISVGVFAFFWLAQRLLRRGIDPNRSKDRNGNPRVPIGTPPALLKRIGPGGEAVLEAVPSELSNLQEEASWATFRVGQLVWVPMCVECLDAATTVYKMPMVAEGKPIPAPLCQGCLRRLRGKWWLCNFVGGLIAFGLMRILMMLPSGIDQMGQWMGTIMGGGFLAVVSFMIIEKLLLPYRIRARWTRVAVCGGSSSGMRLIQRLWFDVSVKRTACFPRIVEPIKRQK